jgi:hypothetical protein
MGFGGGSSGGGGGSSGKVDFPDYMKAFHGNFLGTDSASVTLTSAMNTALAGNSPYYGFVTVGANEVLLESGKSIGYYGSPFSYLKNYCAMDFENIFNNFKTNLDYSIANPLASYQSPTIDLTKLQNFDVSKLSGFDFSALSGFDFSKLSNFDLTAINTYITNLMNAENALLEEDVSGEVANLQSELRSVNAVMSSALAVGEAIIRTSKVKALAKSDASLRLEGLKLNADLITKELELRGQVAEKATALKAEVAVKEVETNASVARNYAELQVQKGEITLKEAALYLEKGRLDATILSQRIQICMELTVKKILASRDVTTTSLDAAKLYGAMRVELDDAELEIQAKDRLWDLKVYQYGGNFLGSISGSAVSTDPGAGRRGALGFLGGAMSGAAMAAMIPGVGQTPIGLGLGAVAGGLFGLLGS